MRCILDIPLMTITKHLSILRLSILLQQGCGAFNNLEGEYEYILSIPFHLISILQSQLKSYKIWIFIFILTFQVMDVLWSTTGMPKSLIWKTRGIRCVENCLVKDTIFQKSLTHTHSSEYLEMKNIVFWRSKFVTLKTCVVH